MFLTLDATFKIIPSNVYAECFLIRLEFFYLLAHHYCPPTLTLRGGRGGKEEEDICNSIFASFGVLRCGGRVEVEDLKEKKVLF